jgi:hypothetical protein
MDSFEVFGQAAPDRELFYWSRERSGHGGRDVTTFRRVPGVTSLRVPPSARLRGRPDDCPGQDDSGAAGRWPARPERRPDSVPDPEPEVPADEEGQPAPARPSPRRARRGTAKNP